MNIVPVLNLISGLTCDSVASAKGISLVSLVADTYRHMVSDPTIGIDAAKTGTRVLALSGDAGQLLGAVRVDHTLRATVGGRANHLRHACAPTLTTNIPWRQCVWSTWVGIARVLLNNRLDCCEGVIKIVNIYLSDHPYVLGAICRQKRDLPHNPGCKCRWGCG